MKRLQFILSFLLISLFSSTLSAAEIWVSINGSDKNSGTITHPFATIDAALRKARELRRLNDATVQNGIFIHVSGGVYQRYEPLFIRPEDSGTETSPTIIQAVNGANPIISGGIQIKNWQRLKSTVQGLHKSIKDKIWVADLSYSANQLFNCRQLWVNGSKATRAKNTSADSMLRILSWNHADETCWIPAAKEEDITQLQGAEMFIHQWWAIATLRIKSAKKIGDSVLLSFHQPESKIQSEHPWPAPWISKETGNSAFYLTNAIQFLNEPGEWFLDVKNQKMYYYPHANENMETAEVIAPAIETLVNVEGTIDNPVHHISFQGIQFQHTTWMRPSNYGHVPLQAGMYLLDAYKLKIPGTEDKRGLENQAWIGRPKAAVNLSYTHHTSFINCVFQHLASTGIDYVRGASYDKIERNVFKDIGGTAIQLGVYSDEAFETHLPYSPTDEREICKHLQVTNNVVNNVANEDWGCVGISAGYVQNTLIQYNDVSDVSYSGICVGWGWTKTINALKNNKILNNQVTRYAKHMYDVGGLYTLSAQPGTLIANNYIDSIYKAPYAHDPNHWFYFYLDEGSAYITIQNNWCPSEKVMRNSNGPGNTWENNGPSVSDTVKMNAGLQQKFNHLLKYKNAYNNWPINTPSKKQL